MLERYRLKVLYPVLLPCLGALLLGIYYGSGRSITLDESTTLYWSYHVFHFNFSDLLAEIHTPSYDVIIGLWFSLFGFTHEAATAFSAVMTVVSIGAAYAFVRRQFDAESAELSAWLLAVSPLLVFYSQYARAYAFFIALSILSAYFYFELDRARSARNRVGYVVATYFLICSHLAAFAVVLAQWIHFAAGVVRRRESRRLKEWFALQALMAALYTPILVVILKRYDLRRDIPLVYSWVHDPGPRDLLNAMVFLSGSSTALAIVYVAMAGLLARRREHGAQQSCVDYLFLWLGIPPITLFAISKLFHPIFIERGFASSAIPLLMIAAVSWRNLKSKSVRAAAACAFFALSCVALLHRSFGDFEDWEKASEALRGAKASKVFIHPGYAALPLAYYFKPECFYSAQYKECLTEAGIRPVDGLGDLNAGLGESNAQFWFLGYNVAKDENDRILSALKSDSRFQLVAVPGDIRSMDLAGFELRAR